MSPQRPERALTLYLRTHGLREFIVGMLLASVALVLSLHSSFALTNWDGTAETPMSAIVTGAFGAVAGYTWGARTPEYDDLSGEGRVASLRRWHPPVVILGTALSGFVVMYAATAAVDPALASGRALVGWCGLGFLSAALMRSTLAWVLPLGLVMVSSFAGYDAHVRPVWWNLASHSAGDEGAWVLAGCVAVLGVAATRVDRWTWWSFGRFSPRRGS